MKKTFLLIILALFSSQVYANSDKKHTENLSDDCQNYLDSVKNEAKIYQFKDSHIDILLKTIIKKELTPSKDNSKFSCKKAYEESKRRAEIFYRLPETCQKSIYFLSELNTLDSTLNKIKKMKEEDKSMKDRMNKESIILDTFKHIIYSTDNHQETLRKNKFRATKICDAAYHNEKIEKYGINISKYWLSYLDLLEQQLDLYQFSSSQKERILIDNVTQINEKDNERENIDNYPIDQYFAYSGTVYNIKNVIEYSNLIKQEMNVFNILPKSCQNLVFAANKKREKNAENLTSEEILSTDRDALKKLNEYIDNLIIQAEVNEVLGMRYGQLHANVFAAFSGTSLSLESLDKQCQEIDPETTDESFY